MFENATDGSEIATKSRATSLVASGDELAFLIQPMSIALRWREDPFDCELIDTRNGAFLSIFADGELVWHELVRSAAAAYERAREVTASLLEPRAKRDAG
jgi:hypothetical protein